MGHCGWASVRGVSRGGLVAPGLWADTVSRCTGLLPPGPQNLPTLCPVYPPQQTAGTEHLFCTSQPHPGLPQLARAVPARRSPTAIYWHTSDLRFLVGRCPSGLYPSGGTTAHPVKCPSTTRSRAGSSARSTSCSLPTVLKSFLSTSYPPLAVVDGLERGLVSLLSGTRR